MRPVRHQWSTLRRLRTRIEHTFFANFFRLLLIAITLSQWFVLWWLFPQRVRTLPASAQLAGVVLVYGTNRMLALRARRRRSSAVGPMPRLYYAMAFTCLFCTSFLVLTGILWVGAKIFLEAIVVEARTFPTGLGFESGLDTGFRWLANAGVATIAIAFTYGYSIGQQRLRVTRLRLPLRRAAGAFDGLRIAQISDIHIGLNLDLDQLSGFVDRVNALEPDLICITGDIVDGPSADVDHFLPLLARLRATHGVFAILGNHDHYAGADRVEAALRRQTPFTVLRDERTALDIDGRRLHIIGLDDRGRDWARGVAMVPYLAKALAGIPSDEPILLLCHRPDIFPRAADGGVSLTLSGHTHGGQLGIPWLHGRVRNLAEFITPFDRGLFERDGAHLYVNCGLGVTGQRIRLSTPREITLIEVDGGRAAECAA